MLEDGTAARHAALAAELRREGALAVGEGTRTVGRSREVRGRRTALVALGDHGAPLRVADLADALEDVARARRHRPWPHGIVRPAEHLPELLLYAAARLAGSWSSASTGR